MSKQLQNDEASHSPTNKFYTRRGHEELYARLQKERGFARLNVNGMSDYKLLSAINELLIHFGAVPMTTDELEMDLN